VSENKVLRRIKRVDNLGWYMTRDDIVIYTGHLMFLG